MLDEHALDELIAGHYREHGDRLFRMERLPLYDVPHQAAELASWRAGGEPDMSGKQAWLDILADEKRRGLVSQRVRVLSADLSDDEQRACHWGYPHTGRYEDIRVLHRGEHVIPEGLVGQDYWIVADQLVVPMHYDTGGRFVGAEVLGGDRVVEFECDRERAWNAAEPFGTWWARHTELHRRRVA